MANDEVTLGLVALSERYQLVWWRGCFGGRQTVGFGSVTVFRSFPLRFRYASADDGRWIRVTAYDGV